jgi:hypothetical protein
MGTVSSTLTSAENILWDTITGSPTAYWNGEENPSFVFPFITPPYYRELLEENGVDTAQAFYLTADGISHEARHKIINARAVQRLLTIDIKSMQFVAVTERQWKLLFSYVPPVIPCEIIISFYVKVSPYAKQLKLDSATFSSEPILLQPREHKKPANSKDRSFCVRFDSRDYNILASPTSLPSLKHCTKYPSDHVFDVSILVRPASTKSNSSAGNSNPSASSSSAEKSSPLKGFGHNRVQPVSTDSDAAAMENVRSTEATHGTLMAKKGIMPLEMVTVPSLFVPTSVTSEWSPEKFVWQELFTFSVDPTFVRPFAAKFIEDERNRSLHSVQLKREQKRFKRAVATGAVYNPPPGIILTPKGVAPVHVTGSPGQGHHRKGSVKTNHHGAYTRQVLVQPTDESNNTARTTDPAVEMTSMDSSSQKADSNKQKEHRRGSRSRGHHGNGRQGYQSLPPQQDGLDPPMERGNQSPTLPVSMQVHQPQQARNGGKSTGPFAAPSTPTIFTHAAQLFPVLPMVLQFQKVDFSETVYSVVDVYGQRRRIATLPLVKEITVLEDNHWITSSSQEGDLGENGRRTEPADNPDTQQKDSPCQKHPGCKPDAVEVVVVAGGTSVAVSDDTAAGNKKKKKKKNRLHKPKRPPPDADMMVESISSKPSSEKSSSSSSSEDDEDNNVTVCPANDGSSSTSAPTKKEEDVEEEQQCIVCFSETREVVLFPCRHMDTCLSCAKMLIASRNQCPVCRSTAEAIVHIVAFRQEADAAAKATI